MKTIKVIGNCCLVFLAIISVIISIAFCYYHFFNKDKTIGVNNINDQLAVDIQKVDDLTQEQKDEYEERWFMEANYYSNSKNNGEQVQELKYNYFTGYNLTEDEYRATGMQYMGDFTTYTNYVNSIDEANNRVLNEFYYYDTTFDVNYSGYKGQYGSVSTTLNRNQQFIIKIDNRPFSIQLTGQYDTVSYETSGWWIFKSTKKVTTTTYFDYGDVFDAVFSSIESCDKGYGDYYLKLDISDYFTICEYDTESKKFKTDDVTHIIKDYALIKIHYDENGLVNADQSIFGSIKCNPSYGLKEDVDTTYWQERMLYTLNEDNFSYRYSDTYNGYFISLTQETKKVFEDMPRAKVNINVDLQSQYLVDNKINIVGIDYNGFEKFEIDTLTIKGNNQTFYMLDKSLYDTKLQTLKYSNGITFDFAENAINNEYVGVVL